MCQHSPWRRQVSSSIVPLSGVALLAVSAAPSHPLHPCIAIACHIACRIAQWVMATGHCNCASNYVDMRGRRCRNLGSLPAYPPIHPSSSLGRPHSCWCLSRQAEDTHHTQHHASTRPLLPAPRPSVPGGCWRWTPSPLAAPELGRVPAARPSSLWKPPRSVRGRRFWHIARFANRMNLM